MKQNIIKNVELLFDATTDEQKIDLINKIKIDLHEVSPFKNEPVDCVIWEKNERVVANDYNPNSVAPPEMELLEISINHDGYTQPIVGFENKDKEAFEIVDGFHRHRVGKESKVVNERVKGYLPVVNIRTEQQSKNDRIASTIRHNRARGKHKIDAMSEIVIELKNRNWRNTRIAKELGMDEEEVLRLLQITGMEEMFKDDDFSNAWNAEDQGEYEVLTDELSEEEMHLCKVVNVDDPNRIFHTYDRWECFKAGLYATNVNGKTEEECKQEYYNVLTNPELFRKMLGIIIDQWTNSCEHYLTNTALNRIAWLGQAAVCLATGVPSKFSNGWELLSDEQKDIANNIALEYLNKWLKKNSMEEIDLEEALSYQRQINIY